MYNGTANRLHRCRFQKTAALKQRRGTNCQTMTTGYWPAAASQLDTAMTGSGWERSFAAGLATDCSRPVAVLQPSRVNDRSAALGVTRRVGGQECEEPTADTQYGGRL